MVSRETQQAIILFIGIVFSYSVRRAIFPMLYDFFPSKKKVLDEYETEIAIVIYTIATIIYMSVMGRFM